LIEKQRLLQQREARVNELEELIARKDKAVKELRKKIADALLGFRQRIDRGRAQRKSVCQFGSEVAFCLRFNKSRT
jgi:uncharacterized coiled-coil protein SlyX